MHHFMVDLETMGTRPYSVIASVGIVQFDIHTGRTGKEFYMTVDELSCIKAGLNKDPDTVAWWKRQDPAVRAKLFVNVQPLKTVLAQLGSFIVDACPAKSLRELWGNAASFDLGLLNNAYEKCKMTVPWEFYNERCCRTIVMLNPDVKMMTKKPKGAHDPIVDCKFQIDYVVRTIQSIKNETYKI